jgi:hypothetical protein
MAPRAAGDDVNAKWQDKEVLGLLTGLIDKKTSAQSSNGWKPTVWPGLVATVQAINLDAKPVKDKEKLVTKLKNVHGWSRLEAADTLIFAAASNHLCILSFL